MSRQGHTQYFKTGKIRIDPKSGDKFFVGPATEVIERDLVDTFTLRAQDYFPATEAEYREYQRVQAAKAKAEREAAVEPAGDDKTDKTDKKK